MMTPPQSDELEFPGASSLSEARQLKRDCHSTVCHSKKNKASCYEGPKVGREE